ncbi:MAG TPA: hypothetical protein PKZ76_11360 [Xanthomonadaceae bacterium]|nr:hypothetical protein [Xanthomonadaceae bacterium]
MIFDLAEFGADASERAVPGPAEARALIAMHHAALAARIDAAVARVCTRAIDAQRSAAFANAMWLGIARIGHRHGRFGDDFHAYHNEEHALEILDRRIPRLLAVVREGELDAEAWPTLGLFAACHDLRQRERMDSASRVGRNELASVAETFRILDVCGFDQGRDRALYLAIELMIAGSTFDATPTPRSPADAAAAAGPLAPQLAGILDDIAPRWREDADAVRAHALAQVASDLDTANVGEDFAHLCASGARLCIEREMRQGRNLDDSASFEPVLGFLTGAQEHYFFELHRFCDTLGERAFAQGKEANAPRLRALVAQLRSRFDSADPASTGRHVLDAHLQGSGASALVHAA